VVRAIPLDQQWLYAALQTFSLHPRVLLLLIPCYLEDEGEQREARNYQENMACDELKQQAIHHAAI
jgi:hypothetical protein